MATKPFLLVMNKYQYDPISPVQMSPALQSGVVTHSGYVSPIDQEVFNRKSVMSGYGDDSLATAGLGDNESFSGGGASLFAAIGSLVSSIFNYFSQKKLQKQQQEFQKEYFDYTFNKQTEEKWKEIYYDDPWRQMQRLKDAGLNENLMYGTLGNVAQAAGNAPANSPSGLSGSIPTVAPFFDFASPIQALLGPMQAMSQIGLNKSQAFKNYKSAGVDAQQANRLAMLTPLEVEQYRNKNHLLDQEFLKMQNETVKLAKDITERNIYLSLCRRIYQAQLDKLNAESFGIYVKGDYDAAAAVRMARETDIVLPALANSYNASAAEKWQEVKRLSSTLENYKREMSARANVSEAEAESYFWREVVPAYVDAGVDIAGLVLSKGMSLSKSPKTRTTSHYNPDGSPKGYTRTTYE